MSPSPSRARGAGYEPSPKGTSRRRAEGNWRRVPDCALPVSARQRLSHRLASGAEQAAPFCRLNSSLSRHKQPLQNPLRRLPPPPGTSREPAGNQPGNSPTGTPGTDAGDCPPRGWQRPLGKVTGSLVIPAGKNSPGKGAAPAPGEGRGERPSPPNRGGGKARQRSLAK